MIRYAAYVNMLSTSRYQGPYTFEDTNLPRNKTQQTQSMHNFYYCFQETPIFLYWNKVHQTVKVNETLLGLSGASWFSGNMCDLQARDRQFDRRLSWLYAETLCS